MIGWLITPMGVTLRRWEVIVFFCLPSFALGALGGWTHFA